LIHYCQVRGTPGTGKTSLCQLLARHIEEQEPLTDVILISTWTYDADDLRYDRWGRHLKEIQSWVQENRTVFIFDEAQVTYDDSNLWNDFFKNITQYSHCRAIVFTSYGIPTTKIYIRPFIPMIIPDHQRVTLRPIQHTIMDELPAAGLFFTRKEFDNLVSAKYPSPQYWFDTSFFDTLFDITEGHVGATIDFIQVVLADEVRYISFQFLVII
jgi:hypothetical protein